MRRHFRSLRIHRRLNLGGRGFVALLFAVVAAVGMTTATQSAPASATTSYTISGVVYLGDQSTHAGAGDVIVYATPTPYQATFTYVGIYTSFGHAATDANGRYTITGVPEGDFNLYFAYVGSGNFSSEWDFHLATASEIGNLQYYEAGPNFGNQGDDVTLSNTRQQVSGRVTLGATTTPAAGMTVDWRRLDEPTGQYDLGDNTLTTDDNGDFSFSAQEGQYEVSYTPPNATFSTPDTQTFVVDNRPVSFVHALHTIGTLSGHVDVGSSSAGAGDVEVQLTCQVSCEGASAPPPVFTDAYGDWEMGNLPVDDYWLFDELEFTPVGGPPAIPETLYFGGYTYGVGASGLDVRLAPADTISGVVSLGSVDNPAGAGAVTVKATSPGQSPAFTATTNADGSYSLEVPGNSYTLEFFPTDSTSYPDVYWKSASTVSGFGNDATTVTASSTPLTNVNATIPVGSFISGTITRSNGSPAIQGEEVQLYDSDIGWVGAPSNPIGVETDASGHYSYGPLVPGDYSIRVLNNAIGDPLTTTWVGATAQNPTAQSTIHLTAGENVSDANATQFIDTSLTVSPSCPECSGTGTFGSVGLQRYDEITDSWVQIADNYGLDFITFPDSDARLFNWSGLSTGTYRAVDRVQGRVIDGPPVYVTEGVPSTLNFVASPGVPEGLAHNVGSAPSDPDENSTRHTSVTPDASHTGATPSDEVATAKTATLTGGSARRAEVLLFPRPWYLEPEAG